MEEKEISHGEASEEASEAVQCTDSATSSCDAQSSCEAVAAQEEAASSDSLCEGEDGAALEAAQEQQPDLSGPSPDWSFGASTSEEPHDKEARKKGLIGFFAIFGTAFAACILLLFLTFWLGDAGFEIIREMHYDRTVYVREDGTVVGTYTPGEVADQVGKSTVTVSTVNGHGSGFIYSADGYIVTNYHVVSASRAVQVILSSQKVYDAEIIGYNQPADIAVLKIQAEEALTPVRLGNSDAVLIGETVVAIGTPVDLNYAGTVTFGKISANSRMVSFSDADGTVTKKMRVIQTDASVNSGNSGGPLANLEGEVIGVVAMKLSGSKQAENEVKELYYEGLGFALPINGVKEIVDAIVQKGSFNGRNPIAEGRSLLGVTGHAVAEGAWYRIGNNGTIDISPVEQEGFVQMSTTGIHVISVEADSHAEGRVLKGDIITALNGLRMSSIQELIKAVNRHWAGETVTLTIVRGGEEITVEVRLAEEPFA